MVVSQFANLKAMFLSLSIVFEANLRKMEVVD